MAASAQRQRVGAELRRIREELGLSGMYVADALGWSQSKVSRIETARFGATPWELAALLDYYGVPEEVRAEMLTVAAADAGLPGAWIVRAGGPRRRQGEVAEIESRLSRLRQYQAMFVPGQLQSYEYARAIAVAGGFGDPDGIAARRMERQELLRGPDAPKYEAILDMRALLRCPGSKAVLAGQVEHIVSRAALRAVTLRVLPAGVPAANMAMSSFIMYDFREAVATTVVFVEAQTADMYLSASEDVAAYEALFGRLSAEALKPKESIRHLEEFAEEHG